MKIIYLLFSKLPFYLKLPFRLEPKSLYSVMYVLFIVRCCSMELVTKKLKVAQSMHLASSRKVFLFELVTNKQIVIVIIFKLCKFKHNTKIILIIQEYDLNGKIKPINMAANLRAERQCILRSWMLIGKILFSL